MNYTRLGIYLIAVFIIVYAINIFIQSPKQRGHDHELDDKPQGALIQLEEQVKNNPDNVQALIELGHYYQHNNELARAVEIFAHASHVDPNHAEAYVDWAMALNKTGQTRDAEKMFLQAIKKFPDFSDAWLQLGIIYNSDIPDRQKAIFYFEEFLKRDKGSPMAKRVRAELQKIHSQTDK